MHYWLICAILKYLTFPTSNKWITTANVNNLLPSKKHLNNKYHIDYFLMLHTDAIINSTGTVFGKSSTAKYRKYNQLSRYNIMSSVSSSFNQWCNNYKPFVALLPVYCKPSIFIVESFSTINRRKLNRKLMRLGYFKIRVISTHSEDRSW